ncbi:MAG TPA: TetR family transcriptional regulator [Trebonia sp.]|nr:TetR family transcriptional regulator [Trebonia sp.]
MSRESPRDRLAQAAFALFDERGYEQATIDDITERAGVGRTTFFRHYRSKEEVHYLEEGDLARRRYALTSSVPALRHREIATVARYQRLFREFIGDRMDDPAEPTPLRAELMAASVVAAHNHVLRQWLRGESPDPARELDGAMHEVISLFAPTVSTDGTGTTIVAFRASADIEEIMPALRRIALADTEDHLADGLAVGDLP